MARNDPSDLDRILRQTHLIHVNSFHGRPPEGHVWGWGVRPCYILHFITQGGGFLETEKHYYPLEAGQLFLIRPYQLIRYGRLPDRPQTYWWAEWFGEGSDELLRLMGFDDDRAVITPQRPAEILAAMDALERTGSATPEGVLERTAALYRLMACLLRNSPAAEQPAKGGAVYFSAAEQFVRAHLSDPELTVAAVAAHVGISRNYLHTLFVRYAGRSPADYLIDARLDMATELLRLHHLPVVSVAMSVGYPDPFSFTRIYKKRRGIPPSQVK